MKSLASPGQVLAQHMPDYDARGLGILEVGCGIGLTSLRLNQRHCDITAFSAPPTTLDT